MAVVAAAAVVAVVVVAAVVGAAVADAAATRPAYRIKSSKEAPLWGLFHLTFSYFVPSPLGRGLG